MIVICFAPFLLHAILDTRCLIQAYIWYQIHNRNENRKRRPGCSQVKHALTDELTPEQLQ